MGSERGKCFGWRGPPSIPWGLGGGESLKCFQKMRKWSLPLEWLVTPPLKPRAQRPPPGSGTFKGGAGSPDVQMKGPRALPSQQQWGTGPEPPPPQRSPLRWRKGGWGQAHSIPGEGKLCLSPEAGTGTGFGGEPIGGKEDGHVITKASGVRGHVPSRLQ